MAAPRTSTLSAAFLRAAGRGEFIAPWHSLLEALASGDVNQVEAAAMTLEGLGASSGADSLDGFILAGQSLLPTGEMRLSSTATSSEGDFEE